MPLGNDQDMSGSLRIDIFKGKGMLILIDFLGWNLVAKDTAEQTVGHDIGIVAGVSAGTLYGVPNRA